MFVHIYSVKEESVVCRGELAGSFFTEVRRMTDQIHILYVDDDPFLLDIGKQFLERTREFSLTTLESAISALNILDSASFDAIISDYQMPKMDGIGFLKAVRASGNSIPFILFTGKGREEVVIQALNEGADYYLQKGGNPQVQFAELSHKIQLAVRQRRLETSVKNHERREADIINFLPDATFAINSDEVVIAWNREMEKLTGINAQDILGKGNYEYALPFYFERRPMLINLVLHDNPDVYVTYPSIKREGDLLSADISHSHFHEGTGASFWLNASPLYDTRGTIVGAIESIRDITEIKHAELQLQRNHEELHAAYEEISTADEELRHSFDELSRNEQSLKHLAESLSILNGIISTANRADNLSELLWSILEESLQLLDFDGGGIYLVNQVTRTAALAITQNLPADFIEEISSVSIDMKPYDTLFIHNTPIITENYGALAPERSKKYGFLSLASIPLLSKNIAIGALNLASLKRYSISEEEKQILISIGAELGSTIHRMMIEEKVRASSQNLQTLFDSIDEMIFVLDEKGNILAVNNAVQKIVSSSSDELIGTNILRLYHQEDQEETTFLHQNVTYDIFSCSKPLFTKDGIRIDVETKVTRGWWHSKEALIVVSRDVTERKKADKALLESEEKYRRLTDNAQDMIYRMSLPDGTYEYISPASFNLTGYPPEAFYDDPGLTRTLIHPNWQEYFKNEWEKLLKGDMPPIYEYQIIDKDGKERWLYQRDILVRDENGNPAAIEGIVTDITERKLSEESLYEAIKKIRLLTGLTRHDVFNQLAGMQGYHLLAMEESEPDRIKDYITRAHQVGSRIEAVIKFTRDYENFGIESSGWQRIHPIIESAQCEVSLGSITLINDIPEGVEVYADPIIRKVFTTLIENATRHGGKVTRIRFSCLKQNYGIVLICEDDGVGIPQEEKGYVFDRGYGNHTGIGLFLAKEILSITGLSIRECGVEGEGARFEIMVQAGKFRHRITDQRDVQ